MLSTNAVSNAHVQTDDASPHSKRPAATRLTSTVVSPGNLARIHGFPLRRDTRRALRNTVDARTAPHAPQMPHDKQEEYSEYYIYILY